jgi:hypothetical protein
MLTASLVFSPCKRLDLIFLTPGVDPGAKFATNACSDFSFEMRRSLGQKENRS